MLRAMSILSCLRTMPSEFSDSGRFGRRHPIPRLPQPHLHRKGREERIRAIEWLLGIGLGTRDKPPILIETTDAPGTPKEHSSICTPRRKDCWFRWQFPGFLGDDRQFPNRRAP